jgi:hypothetical protein
MKYYEMTFKITGYDNSFKFKNIKPTKLLSLATLFSKSNDIATNEQIFDFALANTEVLLIDKWTPVITILPNGEYVYWPANLEDNLIALNEIITTFVKEVLNKVFTSSNKSEK